MMKTTTSAEAARKNIDPGRQPPPGVFSSQTGDVTHLAHVVDVVIPTLVRHGEPDEPVVALKGLDEDSRVRAGALGL